jgi:hypothetical protein
VPSFSQVIQPTTKDTAMNYVVSCLTSIWNTPLKMARRQHQLRQSRVLRQKAVRDFPLRLVSVVMRMQKLLTHADKFGGTPETTEAIAAMEGVIRKEYTRQFGEEMAGEQGFKNAN